MVYPFCRWYRSFLESLRSLLEAGVPVREALEALCGEGGGRGSRLAGKLLEEVRGGATLAEAMASSPREVPPEHASLVEAGERGGRLVASLRIVERRVDHAQTVAKELVQATAWPFTLLCAAVVLLPIYLLVLGESTIYWTIQLVFFGLLGLLVLAWARSGGPPGEDSTLLRALRRLLSGVPWLGAMLHERATARWFTLVGLLLESGLGLEDAFEQASRAAGSPSLRQGLLAVPAALRAGKKLGDALTSVPDLRLRPTWVARIRVAELSAGLDRVFQDLGLELEERVFQSLRLLARGASVVVFLIVGFVVFLRALAVFGQIGGAL
jgi:type II secretory pathway component PulF